MTASDVIRIWELGRNEPPWERDLAILGVAFPDARREELAALTLGRRNACLLSVREHLFGSRLDGFAECPLCGAALEFAIDAGRIRCQEGEPADEAGERTLESGGYHLRFRALTGADLAAIEGHGGAAAARLALAARAVISAGREGAEVAARELPEPVVCDLAAALLRCDPRAETLLDLECPGCRNRWEVMLDIGGYLWTEIRAQARRLMGEVHVLARAYGWSEAQTLSLSAARREFYLEMVGS